MPASTVSVSAGNDDWNRDKCCLSPAAQNPEKLVEGRIL